MEVARWRRPAMNNKQLNVPVDANAPVGERQRPKLPRLGDDLGNDPTYYCHSR
jgi:hypothetical protein